jgi:DNA-directed RNA polymerase specialized sigma24 family protein
VPAKPIIEEPVTVAILSRLEQEAREAIEAAETATEARNRAFVVAVGQGLRPSEIAAATGLSQARVGQIVRRGTS